MKKITITWAGEGQDLSVKATLLETKNPVLCRKLWDSLPLRGIQDHALISGEYLYGYVPMPDLCSLCHYHAQTKELRSEQKVGRVNVSELQHFSIKYGNVTEYLKVAPVAQIDAADLEQILTIGRRVWESTFTTKNLIMFSVTKYPGDNQESQSLIAHDGKYAAGLAEEINRESERIWLTPPKEVIDLIEGKTETTVGSFGFYFNSIVFADGLMRSLGILSLANLLRMADDKDIAIPMIKEIITQVLPTTVLEFLGYCGFDKLLSYYTRFRDVVPTMSNREDLRNLILALLNYVNRLSGWMLHYFPWVLGQDLKRAGNNENIG